MGRGGEGCGLVSGKLWLIWAGSGVMLECPRLVVLAVHYYDENRTLVQVVHGLGVAERNAKQIIALSKHSGGHDDHSCCTEYDERPSLGLR